jgi:hypothetical protein
VQIRLIANLCEQQLPEAVLQLRASDVSLIAKALGSCHPNGDGDHDELTSAFRSLDRMMQAGKTPAP